MRRWYPRFRFGFALPASRLKARGLTLMELAVAVAILAVLTAIAVPVFLGQRQRSQDAVAISALRNVASEGRSLASDSDKEMAFPGTDSDSFIAALLEVEKSYDLVSSPTSSASPNQVWVLYRDPTIATYAARSDSGTCWYLFDFLTPSNGYRAGLYWFFDNDPATAPICGRDLPLAELPDLLTPTDEHDLPAPPEPLPDAEAYCDGACLTASVWGDPHIVTFDGLGYEFHTVGEYTAMQTKPALAAQNQVPMTVQLRTDSRFDSERVSYTTGVAVRFGEEPTVDVVSFVPTPDTIQGVLKVNGLDVDLEVGEHFTFASGLGASDYETGYVARLTSSDYEVVSPGPVDLNLGRPVVSVARFSSFLNTNVSLTTAYAELVEGLWGNADEDAIGGPYDDLWVAGAEESLEIPVSNHVIHTTFADSWAVSEPESLFAANGHGHLPRDPEYPTRFQTDTPVSDFADFEEAAVTAALAACKDAGVDHYLLEACAFDTVVAGGDLTLRDAAKRGALAASRPRLMNSYDSWQHILTFADGQAPTAKGWTVGPTGGILGLDISYNSELSFHDRTGDNYFRYWCRPGVVGENFTFQADVQATGSNRGNWDWLSGYTSSGFGLALSDGDQMWWARIGPAAISDGNNPSVIYNTNAHTRKAQVRLAKSGSTVALHVDGHHVFDLTPADPDTFLGSGRCSTNSVAFGHIDTTGGSGRGHVYFDNVAYSQEDKQDLGMNVWSPAPWAHILHFADDVSPLLHGWHWGGGEGILSIGWGFEDGALYLDDNTSSNYWRRWNLRQVVGEEFTFQADVKVPGRSNGHTSSQFGVGISDGSNMWWVSLGTFSVMDGNAAVGSKIFTTDLHNRFAQIRLVKSGSTVGLYVDGEYAFDLTPASSSVNEAWFGMSGLSGAGVGRVLYDNVMVAGVSEDLPPMTTWPRWSWLHTLDFDVDGVLPDADGWVADFAWTTSGTSRTVAGGHLQFRDTTTSNSSYWSRYRLDNVVSNEFTFQADVQAPGYIHSVGHGNNGHKTDAMGLLLSDGTHMWWVRVGPTYVADGNLPESSVTGRMVAGLYHRFAQVRIVKTGESAALYVDGEYAFDLTPVEAGTWGNTIAFGQIPDASGSGVVNFDNVKFAAQAYDGALMTPWTPAPWVQEIDGFAEGALPGDYGWFWHGPASQLGTSRTSTGGVFILRDTSSGNAGYWNRYHLRHPVSDTLTWEADVKLNADDPVWTADGQGMLISDTNHQWWVQFNPSHLRDGNGTATFNVDMTAEFVTIRIEKNGTTVSLFVDGAYAFDLTPGDTTTWGSPDWGNTIAFGQVMGANGSGQMMVSSLRVGP